MQQDRDTSQTPRISFGRQTDDNASEGGALYSNSIEESQASDLPLQLPAPNPPEGLIPAPPLESDTIASGTFGALFKSKNLDRQSKKGVIHLFTDSRVELNLYEIKPTRPSKSGDRCEAWRELRF